MNKLNLFFDIHRLQDGHSELKFVQEKISQNMISMKMLSSQTIQLKQISQEKLEFSLPKSELNPDFKEIIQSTIQDLNIIPRKNLFIILVKSLLSDGEGDRLLRIKLLLQEVLDLVDTFQRHALNHQTNKTSHDGLYPKLVDQKMKDLDPTEIKLTIQDLPSVVNVTQRIELDNKLILDRVVDLNLINQVLLKIRCKEDLVSNYFMLSGEKTTSVFFSF